MANKLFAIIRRVIQKVVKREKFRLTITRERGEIGKREREREGKECCSEGFLPFFSLPISYVTIRDLSLSLHWRSHFVLKT